MELVVVTVPLNTSTTTCAFITKITIQVSVPLSQKHCSSVWHMHRSRSNVDRRILCNTRDMTYVGLRPSLCSGDVHPSDQRIFSEVCSNYRRVLYATARMDALPVMCRVGQVIWPSSRSRPSVPYLVLASALTHQEYSVDTMTDAAVK